MLNFQRKIRKLCFLRVAFFQFYGTLLPCLPFMNVIFALCVRVWARGLFLFIHTDFACVSIIANENRCRFVLFAFACAHFPVFVLWLGAFVWVESIVLRIERTRKLLAFLCWMCELGNASKRSKVDCVWSKSYWVWKWGQVTANKMVRAWGQDLSLNKQKNWVQF